MADESQLRRTCVGCRNASQKRHLMRYVKDEQGILKMDPDATMQGRGAYTCIDSKCLAKALKKNAFSRALRGSVRVADKQTLLDRLEELAKTSSPVN